MNSEAEAKIEAARGRVMSLAEGSVEMQKWELKIAAYKATLFACAAWLMSLVTILFTIPIIILAIKIGAILWGM